MRAPTPRRATRVTAIPAMMPISAPSVPVTPSPQNTPAACPEGQELLFLDGQSKMDASVPMQCKLAIRKGFAVVNFPFSNLETPVLVSCRHTTSASKGEKLSAHTFPHCSPIRTSTAPLFSLPPLSLTSVCARTAATTARKQAEWRLASIFPNDWLRVRAPYLHAGRLLCTRQETLQHVIEQPHLVTSQYYI